MDDHSLWKSCKPGNKSQIETVELLETSMVKVDSWIKENRLKLNPNKTEFIKFGHGTQLEKRKVENINICDTVIVPSNVVWYVGALLYLQMNLKYHATMKCKAAILNLRKLDQLDNFWNKILVRSLCVVLDWNSLIIATEYSMEHLMCYL